MSTVTIATQLKRIGIRHLIVGHPLVTYFLLAFAGTWLLELPIVLGQDGLGILPYHVPLPIYIVLFLACSFTGPTLAAILVTAALEGREGIKAFLRRYLQWRVGIQWYLLVIFGTPLVYILAASLWLGVTPIQAVLANWPAFFTFYLPALLIFPALITWGEEPGWRGFALTRMQTRYNPLVSGLVVGLLHGLWHLPSFLLVSGPPALGPFSISQYAFNTLAIMVITITWTWIFNNASGSILIAVLAHSGLNASQAYIGSVVPNYPASSGTVALGIFLVIAVILIVATKGQLSYRPIIANRQSRPSQERLNQEVNRR